VTILLVSEKSPIKDATVCVEGSEIQLCIAHSFAGNPTISTTFDMTIFQSFELASKLREGAEKARASLIGESSSVEPKPLGTIHLTIQAEEGFDFDDPDASYCLVILDQDGNFKYRLSRGLTFEGSRHELTRAEEFFGSLGLTVRAVAGEERES
jgi:hypothetical protein